MTRTVLRLGIPRLVSPLRIQGRPATMAAVATQTQAHASGHAHANGHAARSNGQANGTLKLRPVDWQEQLRTEGMSLLPFYTSSLLDISPGLRSARRLHVICGRG
jgi:hypothetical protein